MLELVVLWHELGYFKCEGLNHTCKLKYFDKTLSVLLQLFGFELFVDIQVFDAVLQSLNNSESLLILLLFVET